MATTTVRVDTETHALLVELSAASNRSLIETVRDATEALRRQRFSHQVQHEIAALRRDPAAWADYLSEGEESHVADGIG